MKYNVYYIFCDASAFTYYLPWVLNFAFNQVRLFLFFTLNFTEETFTEKVSRKIENSLISQPKIKIFILRSIRNIYPRIPNNDILNGTSILYYNSMHLYIDIALML